MGIKIEIMKTTTLFFYVVLLSVCFLSTTSQARTLHNKRFKFNITIPDRMARIDDSTDGLYQQIYYDTTIGLIFIISARESTFKSVTDYIDCSRQGLEQAMKTNYGDSLLTMKSCNRSQYYPDQTTVLNFEVSVLPFGFDRYVVYFIHHHHKDLQLSFTYKKENEQPSLAAIGKIMNTLRLR